MKQILSLMAFLCIFPILSFGQNVEEDISKEIKKILRYETDIPKKETPGFLVALVEPDTQFVVSYGERVGESSALDSSEYFAIGGLSKLITAIVSNHLILENVIEPSSKIADDIPYFNGTDIGLISFSELLHHSSGIKRTLRELQVAKGLTRDILEGVSESGFLRSLEATPLESEKKFIYSDHNYALINYWVFNKTGRSTLDWYGSIRRLYPQLPFVSTERMITKGLNKAGKVEPSISYGIYNTSKGLKMKMSEVIELLRFLQDENPLSKSLLSDPVDTELSRHIGFCNGIYKINKGKKYTLYAHGGHSNIHSASIHFVPETKTGIVILSNSEIGTKDLYLSLIAMINYNWKRKPYGQEK